jgi:hypothetical protein
VVAGAGLVFSPPAGPCKSELAGCGAHRGGGQAQQAAGFGDADLDHAGVLRGVARPRWPGGSRCRPSLRAGRRHRPGRYPEAGPGLMARRAGARPRRRAAPARTSTARCGGGRTARAGPDAGRSRPAPFPAGDTPPPAISSRPRRSASAGTPAGGRGCGSRKTPGEKDRTGCGGAAASAAARPSPATPSGSRGGLCSRARTSESPTPWQAPAVPPHRPGSCRGAGAAGPGSRTGPQARTPSQRPGRPGAACRCGRTPRRRRPSRTARRR